MIKKLMRYYEYYLLNKKSKNKIEVSQNIMKLNIIPIRSETKLPLNSLNSFRTVFTKYNLVLQKYLKILKCDFKR